MSNRRTILETAARFGQFLACGLLTQDEAESALLQRAAELTDDSESLLALETAVADALSRSTTDHEIRIAERIRAAIMPLVTCRACKEAIIAQARHANNARGRLNALPDADVIALVKAELSAAMARIREAKRAR